MYKYSITNSPNYQWHVTTLRNYIGVKSEQVESMELHDIEFKPFGQDTETRGGGPVYYTPPSRFVRAFYSKVVLPKIENMEDGIHEAFPLF